MVLAVLQQHSRLRLHGQDVFVSSVGGARLTDTSNDVAIALAVASAALNRPLNRDVVAIGELGLSGELRRVRDLDLRLGEAARMGFTSALVANERPGKAGRVRDLDGLRVVEVDHVQRALGLLDLHPSTTESSTQPRPPLLSVT
jgi:DNA repair protein RadA/Sms